MAPYLKASILNPDSDTVLIPFSSHKRRRFKGPAITVI
jgi:hypothetical protein